MSADTWAALTTFGGASYHALWAPLLLVELLATLAQVVFTVLMLVLFFQRRTCFPKLMIGFYIASALLQGIDLMMSSLLPAITLSSKGWRLPCSRVSGCRHLVGFICCDRAA